MSISIVADRIETTASSTKVIVPGSGSISPPKIVGTRLWALGSRHGLPRPTKVTGNALYNPTSVQLSCNAKSVPGKPFCSVPFIVGNGSECGLIRNRRAVEDVRTSRNQGGRRSGDTQKGHDSRSQAISPFRSRPASQYRYRTCAAAQDRTASSDQPERRLP